MTQKAPAVKLSLTRTSVTNSEKGRQQLLVHTLIQISVVLNVSPDVLLPEPQSLIEELDDLLKTESQAAQEWIRATVEKE